MIRINLLGEQARTSKSGGGIVLAYFGSLAACCLLFLFLYSSISGRIDELNEKRTRLEQELAKLEAITKDVKDLEKTKRELTMKLSVLATLKLSKRGPVRVLDDLNVAAPKSLWITEMQEIKGVLEIRGVAMDNAQVVDLMKALEKSDYFKTVDLVDSTQAYLVRSTDDLAKLSAASGPASQTKSAKGHGRSGGNSSSRQNTDAAGARDLVHKLVAYEGLSKEQRDAFARDAFGVGLKVRSFTLRCGINYAGKFAPAIPTPSEGEAGNEKPQPIVNPNVKRTTE